MRGALAGCRLTHRLGSGAHTTDGWVPGGAPGLGNETGTEVGVLKTWALQSTVCPWDRVSSAEGWREEYCVRLVVGEQASGCGARLLACHRPVPGWKGSGL